MKELDRPTIESLVITAIEALLEDSDLDLDEPIASETTLNDDLCLSSVEAMELFARVDIAINRRLRYEQLVLVDGQYRDELTVGELVDFIWENQDSGVPKSQPM